MGPADCPGGSAAEAIRRWIPPSLLTTALSPAPCRGDAGFSSVPCFARRRRLRNWHSPASSPAPAVTSAFIAEQDFGQLEGQRYDAVLLPDGAENLAAWEPPGGESFNALAARVRTFLKQEAGDGDAVVICHAGPIRAALAMATGHRAFAGPGVRDRTAVAHRADPFVRRTLASRVCEPDRSERMTGENPQSHAERHNEKMKKLKVARDRMMETKTVEKGLVIVHTGKGKGKTTAAMGMVCRAIGHGQKIAVIQFIKGAWATGEKAVFDAFPDQVTMQAMGGGFTWETQDRDGDIAKAMAAWEAAKTYIADPRYRMVMCDEINIALRYDYIPLADVIETLKNKPADKHVILTGRNAKDELIEIADLVTDMVQVKHPFRDGVKAQEGIEF